MGSVKKRRKDSRRLSMIGLVGMLTAGVLLAAMLTIRDRLPLQPFEDRSRELKEQVRQALVAQGIAPVWMQEVGKELQVRVPPHVSMVQIYQELSSLLEERGGTVTQGKEQRESRSLVFTYAIGRRVVEKVRLQVDPTLVQYSGRAAIIIDDFGYHVNGIVRELMHFPVPLTFAVIPGLPHSRQLATELHELGKPVLIHMPMEPMQGRVESDGFTLFTNLTEEETRQRIEKAVEEVPFAIGMNNHMGSRATADSALMTATMATLKELHLFFIDSRTSRQSVAYETARYLGVPALENTLFLDAIDDSAHVAMKLHRLAATASQKGWAIGIGHPRRHTLAALRALVPLLQAQGLQFTTVDSLLAQRPAMLP